jgi:WD40 repeat protein
MSNVVKERVQHVAPVLCLAAPTRDDTTGSLAGERRAPLPPALGYCEVFEHFLSPAECRGLIERVESTGFAAASDDYPPSYRNNDRLVVDDPTLAAQLFHRLQQHAPQVLPAADAVSSHEHFALARLNERIRFCRYRAGQEFTIHQDGVYHADEQHQSRLTFMIYLTDGDDFGGGDTLFYARGPTAHGAPAVVARVRPRIGMLILFDHSVWHAGEPVTRGRKHVVRSDVLYRRVHAVDRDARALPFVGHQGYVWALAKLDEGFASGGRDRAIRLWSDDGTPRGVLHGHQQSVLGLAAYGQGQLASVSRDRTLRLWDVPSQRCLRSTVAHQAAALCVAALEDEGLATGGADGVVSLWASGAQPAAALHGHSGWVWALAPLPQAGLLASASEDGDVRLWSLSQRTCAGILRGCVPLRTLAVSPDQTTLVTGDTHGRVQMWTDLNERPRLVHTFAAHDAAVRRVRYLDADTLATAGEDGHVRCWQSSDLTLRFEARHTNFATDVLPLSDRQLVSCSYDGTILASRLATALGASE